MHYIESEAIADDLNDGDATMLEDEIAQVLSLTPELADAINRSLAKAPHAVCALPSKYIVKTDGIYYRTFTKATPSVAVDNYICAPLEILGFASDEHSQNHGLLLRFEDYNHVFHWWVLPFEMLAGDGESFRKCLMSMGLRIGTGNAPRLLQDMFQRVQVGRRYLNASKVGWHHGAFVLGQDVFGSIDQGTWDKAFFPTEGLEPDYWRYAGTLQDWQQTVSVPSAGNSRLVFAISMAFAAPLVGPTGEESGGIHLFGRSSTGKTTALHVANSVWGGKKRLQRWRATSNGLEAIVGTFNDTLLCLDELAEIQARDAGATAYMLANGSGKLRAHVDGGPKHRRTWQLLFLSSGEIPLAEHVAEAGGKKAKAGQLVRMVDVQAEVAKGHGVFESIGEHQNGSVFSRFLKTNSSRHYGVAGRAFVEQLTGNLDLCLTKAKHSMMEFNLNHVDPQADGQVARVAARFALIAAAGEIATEMGITGWTAGEATKAAVILFKDWIEYRGGIGDRETMEILEHVRRFFEQHGESRFSPWISTGDTPRTHNRAGYVRVENGLPCFYVFSEVFKAEICHGFNRQVVLEVLKNGGYLAYNQYPHFSTKSPDNQSAKYYKICQILETPEVRTDNTEGKVSYLRFREKTALAPTAAHTFSDLGNIF